MKLIRVILLLFVAFCIGCSCDKKDNRSSIYDPDRPLPRQESNDDPSLGDERSDALPPRIDPTDPNVIRPADPHP